MIEDIKAVIVQYDLGDITMAECMHKILIVMLLHDYLELKR